LHALILRYLRAIHHYINNSINFSMLGSRCSNTRSARPITWTAAALRKYHLDGRRTLYVSSSVSMNSSVRADFTVTDSSGKTIFDSSAERQREKLKHEQKKLDLQQLDEQVASAIEEHYRNGSHPETPLLDSLLASHLSACNDPDNEFVYLYELRDALAKKFGSDAEARKALSIPSTE
jgi:hypothetical protein